MKINYWQDFEEGKTYHIYNRAVSNELLFRDDIDYKQFLNKFNKYFGNYFEVYAYCLIPNHFHFLVKVKSQENFLPEINIENTNASRSYLLQESTINDFLIDQLRRFFSSYSLSYNSKYLRRGPLFSPKVKRVSIESDVKFVYLIAYIHHNPIHHGLTLNYDDWIYSSYKAYFGDSESKLAIIELLDWIGSINVFIKIHSEFKLNMLESNNLD